MAEATYRHPGLRHEDLIAVFYSVMLAQTGALPLAEPVSAVFEGRSLKTRQDADPAPQLSALSVQHNQKVSDGGGGARQQAAGSAHTNPLQHAATREQRTSWPSAPAPCRTVFAVLLLPGARALQREGTSRMPSLVCSSACLRLVLCSQFPCEPPLSAEPASADGAESTNALSGSFGNDDSAGPAIDSAIIAAHAARSSVLPSELRWILMGGNLFFFFAFFSLLIEMRQVRKQRKPRRFTAKIRFLAPIL